MRTEEIVSIHRSSRMRRTTSKIYPMLQHSSSPRLQIQFRSRELNIRGLTVTRPYSSVISSAGNSGRTARGPEMSHRDLVMRHERMSRCEAVWHEIFSRAQNATPFLSYEWFLALSTRLFKTDPEVMVFYNDKQPVGIFPGMIENNTLRFYSDERVTDLVDMLFLPDCGEEILQELVQYIETENCHLDLYPIEADSLLADYISEYVTDVVFERADLCPLVLLPDSWDEYLESLTGKSRHELRRKLRKVEEIKMKTLEPDALDTLFTLMAASDSTKKEFLTSQMRDFFDAIARYFFHKKYLRFCATYLDSQPLGVLFSFHMHDRVYLYNSGFNPEYAYLSPGVVTIALDIMSAIDEGMKFYDFLRGEEDYKFRFGAHKRYTIRLRR
jgi:CelD/BcsL family acetyltransferase involved in cellulose biosynthesis